MSVVDELLETLNEFAAGPSSEVVDSLLDEAGIDVLTYHQRAGRYRISISPKRLDSQRAVLGQLFKMAHDSSHG